MESMALIQNSYVDEEKVKSKELVQGAIKGMMGQLDPFSQYLDPEEHNDMKQDTAGSFGGLGIEISIRNKVLTVVSPIEGTPADGSRWRTRLLREAPPELMPYEGAGRPW